MNPKDTRRVAVLSTYLDGGGSVTDPSSSCFSLAGYLGTDEQWAGFEADWKTALDDAGVSALHMKDFAHGTGEFAPWKRNETKRSGFISRLADVIHKHDLGGFAYTVNLLHYRQIDKEWRLHEALPPYVYVSVTAMGKIRDWQRRHRPSDTLLFLFERGDAGQGPFRDWMDRMLDAEAGILQPAFIPKRTETNGTIGFCRPLEAADFLAYETNKMITDLIVSAKTKVRASMFRLIPPERAPINGYLEVSHIMGAVTAWRVRRR